MDLELVAQNFCIPPNGPHLEEALTHPSFSNETRRGRHYQRLEFLGDAVLQLCASEALWRTFPDAHEGELTRRRAQLVNAEALAEFGRKNGVPAALKVGRGAEVTGIRSGTNVLSDAVEALIAAAYLDAGFEAARSVCERIVSSGLSRVVADPKTQLQEQVQAAGGPTPQYVLVESWGAAHEPQFRVRVVVRERVLGEGVGRSKRAAERAAAEAALATGADWRVAPEGQPGEESAR